MKGWRIKLIFLCIIYFAGFATAVYMLAPPPEAEKEEITQSQTTNQGQIHSALANFDKQEFVKSFNSGMHKCIGYGRDAAKKTAEYVKEKAKDSELLKSGSRDSHI